MLLGVRQLATYYQLGIPPRGRVRGGGGGGGETDLLGDAFLNLLGIFR